MPSPVSVPSSSPAPFAPLPPTVLPGAFSTNTPLSVLPRSSSASALVLCGCWRCVARSARLLDGQPFLSLPEITFCAAFAGPPTVLPDDRSCTPSAPLPSSSPLWVAVRVGDRAGDVGAYEVALYDGVGRVDEHALPPKLFMTRPLIVVPAAPAPETASPNAFVERWRR